MKVPMDCFHSLKHLVSRRYMRYVVWQRQKHL